MRRTQPGAATRDRIAKIVFRKAILGTIAVLGMAASPVGGQAPPASSAGTRQSLDDAWWTGPMLAPSASTLSRGHFLIEPYLFDVTVQGRYDRDGVRRGAAHANSFGSLTYIEYGLADRVTVGVIPTFSYNTASGYPDSSRIGIGDLTLQAQYRLTKFHEGSWVPTISVALQETLPTGKYDRLGERPTDGFGRGAYTTTLGLFSQTYFWLPNGRILRMRFNVLPAFSNNVTVRDVSVYGTAAGFRGRAEPGNSVFINAAWEYSLTRRWVLALDATYRHDGNTHVIGHNILNSASPPDLSNIRLDSGSSEAFGLAPAIEYNLDRNLGVLFGVRLIPAGRNVAFTITPALAINFVH